MTDKAGKAAEKRVKAAEKSNNDAAKVKERYT